MFRNIGKRKIHHSRNCKETKYQSNSNDFKWFFLFQIYHLFDYTNINFIQNFTSVAIIKLSNMQQGIKSKALLSHLPLMSIVNIESYAVNLTVVWQQHRVCFSFAWQAKCYIWFVDSNILFYMFIIQYGLLLVNICIITISTFFIANVLSFSKRSLSPFAVDP